MKMHVTQQQFNDMMRKYFSYNACQALYEYYEQLEQELQTDTEFDPIGINCDWYEYKTIKEAKKDICYEEHLPLREYTQVIDFDGGVLILAF